MRRCERNFFFVKRDVLSVGLKCKELGMLILLASKQYQVTGRVYKVINDSSLASVVGCDNRTLKRYIEKLVKAQVIREYDKYYELNANLFPTGEILDKETKENIRIVKTLYDWRSDFLNSGKVRSVKNFTDSIIKRKVVHTIPNSYSF